MPAFPTHTITILVAMTERWSIVTRSGTYERRRVSGYNCSLYNKE